MNLLVTNTQEDQAYLIIRSLREHVDNIFVAVEEGGFFKRWSGMSLWSRFVKRRHRVPACGTDWRAGRLQKENTEAEEAYIQAIEEICRRESIDCIFPSYDSDVYVLSKNRERLADRGVVAVCPDYEQLCRFLDKSETLEAARRVGFPVPRTRIITKIDDLAEAAREISPPWVLKSRCDAHAANIGLARHKEELKSVFRQLQNVQDRPLLQEFVPPETTRTFYVVVGRDNEVVSVLSPKVHRTRKTGLQTPCAAVESSREIPLEYELRGLLRELGAWGGFTVQTIVDARDGKQKLMEINPRVGHNLWYQTELDINAPLLLLRIARGEDPGPVLPVRDGVILLDPLWDSLHLVGQALDQSAAWIRRMFGGATDEAEPYEKESIRLLLRQLRSEYFGNRPRVTSPLNRGYFSDPLPPLAHFLSVLGKTIKRRLR